jgi:hypothetical protein
MSEALGAKEISGGVVHALPADMKRALTSYVRALETWEDITCLARNAGRTPTAIRQALR